MKLTSVARVSPLPLPPPSPPCMIRGVCVRTYMCVCVRCIIEDLKEYII